MAKASRFLIEALERTAARLSTPEVAYQWGHMGLCNCGHLAQEVTHYSKAEIHAYAMQTRLGDWADQVSAFCPGSGMPMDLVIESMLRAGFSASDLKHLERLADPQVLALVDWERRQTLRHNVREDVICYLQAWAELLRGQLSGLEETAPQQTLALQTGPLPMPAALRPSKAMPLLPLAWKPWVRPLAVV